jgi:hypothetical protein
MRSDKSVLHNVSTHACLLPGNVLAASDGRIALCWRPSLGVRGNLICGSTFGDKIWFTGYCLSICLFSLYLTALSVTEGYVTTIVSNSKGFWRWFTTQNCWVLDFAPSSGILENRKHDISETGSVSVLKWRGEKALTQLDPLERVNLNQWIDISSF